MAATVRFLDSLAPTRVVERAPLVWITGLAGAGKTTVARALVARLRAEGHWVAHVDGDKVRAMFGDDLGHDEAGRKANAWRVAKLCKFAHDQGALVVCSTMSMYPEIWEHNRAAFPSYLEVMLDVPMDVLRSRDQKGLYSNVADNVAGLTLGYERPHAHLTLRNELARDVVGNVERLHQRVTQMLREASGAR